VSKSPVKYEELLWTGRGYDICAECGDHCQQSLRVTFADVCLHLCYDCVATLKEHLQALEATLEEERQ